MDKTKMKPLKDFVLLDSSLLEPGCIDFNLLNDSFLITIMPFDLYGKGFYRYTFTMRCEEDISLHLGDGAVRIFLNTKGTNEETVSQELVELLHYIEKTDEASSDASRSERIKEIHEHVLKIKSSEEIGVKYMQAWEEKALAMEEERAEGRSEGEARIIAMIRKKMTRGMDCPAISEMLELDEDYVKKVMGLIDSDEKLSDLAVAGRLVKQPGFGMTDM